MIEPYLPFFQQLSTPATIVTPNRRLAAHLYKFYHQQQIAQSALCWQTPDILPIGAWIERTFNDFVANEFTAAPYLLNAIQEQFLWEKILVNAKESEQLLQISETAIVAQSAWNLLKQWNIDINHAVFQSAEDYCAFQNWSKEFQSQCQKENWIDHANLPNFLIEKILEKKLTPPSILILVGFTDTSPQLNRLLAACKKNRCQISYFDFSIANENSYRITLPDDNNEIITMAVWAQTILQNHPHATIGCVVPNLERKRDRVAQIFSDVFSNKNCATHTVKDALTTLHPFNISAGKNFSRYPIIHAALQLLALNKKTISIEMLSYILHTPFLGDAEKERLQRASIDSVLRQKNIIAIHIPHLINSDDEKLHLLFKQYCPLLLKRLKTFFNMLNTINDELFYHQWGNVFNQLLSALGWPGERSLSSEEYQTVENWLELLTQFTSLDKVYSSVNYYQALQALQNIMNQNVFQPRTPDAPIQILGVLEAAGLPFDFVWVAGMNDTDWPPQPKPNPFIPKSLQREFNMPHATAERELIYCQQLIQTFKRSAKKIYFSHAEKQAELTYQVSPLIEELPQITVDFLSLQIFTPPSETIFLTKNMQILLDDKGPPMSDQEKLVGGINVIKQQALCPFKAFAEWRLHAHELESPLPGLRAKERGTVTHKALEILWDNLKTHAMLMALDTPALHTLIQQCIEQACELILHRHKKGSHYLQLEKERLTKLLSEWLEIEKNRPPFNVLTSEKMAHIQLNQLTLSVRIDRIDELTDGKKLIIDYKTGKNNDINHWFGIRPDEPQLPVYALLDPTNTLGICFAQISPGEHCFKGISLYSLDIQGIKLVSDIKNAQTTSWTEQLDQWNTILLKLSDDFYHGIANVDPKETMICTRCALKPLCRINEDIAHDT